ncbi:unnamed protein product, partial [Owenia fusiformis]
IRKKCKCSNLDTQHMDLSDEAGAIKNLRNNLNDYGSEYFADRETLILIKVEVSPTGESWTYVPMLTELQTDQDFLAKLNPKTTSSQKQKHKRTKSGNDSDDGKTFRQGRRTSIKPSLGERRTSLSQASGDRRGSLLRRNSRVSMNVNLNASLNSKK